MKKFFKWLVITLSVFIFLVVFYALLPIIRIAFFQINPWQTTNGIVQGHSMQDYGLIDGQKITLYANKSCNVGDICSFDCLTDSCKGKINLDGYTVKDAYYNQKTHITMKKLIKIENGCYWFEGNKDKETSWDSRWYGCLMPSEFKIDGVLKQ